MKRIFLLFLLSFLALSGWAWGACPGGVCYVRSDAANDAGTGADFTNAKKTLNGATAIMADGDTIVFAAGTYSTSLSYGRNAGGASVTYRAATSALDAGVAGWSSSYAGTPIIDIAAANEHIWYFQTAGKTVSITGFSFKNARYKLDWTTDSSRAAIYVTAVMTLNLTGCSFYDNAKHLYITAGGTVTYDRCLFRGGYYGDNSYIANSATGAVLTWKTCRFEPSTLSALAPFVFSTAGATANIYNCMFSGVRDYFVRLTQDGTVNFKNNIVMGTSLIGTAIDAFNYTASGTRVINESNNIMIFNPRDRTTGTLGTPFSNLAASASSMTADPKVTVGSGLGYVGITVDDSNNIARAESIASIFNAAGKGISFAVIQSQWTAGGYAAARLQAFVDAGNDIFAHAYSDTDLTKAGPVEIDGTAAGSKVKIVGTPATSIELDNNGDGTAEYTYTLATDGPTVGTFVTWVNSGARVAAGWAARKIGGSATDIDDNALLSGLNAATTVTATGAWTVVPWLIDATAATGHYKNELTDPKAWLQSLIQTGAGGGSRSATYTINYFAYPKGQANANLRNAAAAVYSGARGYSSAQDTVGLHLQHRGGTAEGNIYRIGSIDSTDFSGKSQADTEMQAHSMAQAAMQGTMQFHTTHTVGQLSDDQTRWVLAVWQQYSNSGVAIVTPNAVLDLITNAGSVWEYKEVDATNGGKMWGLKAGSELSASFTATFLLRGSPARNAGTNVGLTSDYRGRAVPKNGFYDIGPYESWVKPDGPRSRTSDKSRWPATHYSP